MTRLGVVIGASTLAVLGGAAAALAIIFRATPNPARGTIVFRDGTKPSRCHGGTFSGVGPLALVSAEGGARRPFLPRRRAGDPSWSPDGRSVALSLFSCTDRARTGIAIADRRSGALRLLTHGPVDREPAWSPDGGTIAFIRETPGKHGGTVTRLFTVPAAGGPARQAGSSRHVENPSWSPDGQRIVVTRGRSGVGLGQPGWLSTLRPDGSGLRQITHGSVDDWRPTWSPDGKWIVFTRLTVPGNAPPDGLFLVHPDGSGLHRLSAGSFFDPAWSPDGRYVVSSGRDYPDMNNPRAGFSLRIMKAHGWLAGTRFRRWTATRRDGLDFEPSWSAQ